MKWNVQINFFSSGFFPAASFMSFQQCEFNFGWRPYKHPPENDFKSFNDVCKLSDEERKILPRPMKLEAMKRLSVKENACTICFDNADSKHTFACNPAHWVCGSCRQRLAQCPFCRHVDGTTTGLIRSQGQVRQSR